MGSAETLVLLLVAGLVALTSADFDRSPGSRATASTSSGPLAPWIAPIQATPLLGPVNAQLPGQPKRLVSPSSSYRPLARLLPFRLERNTLIGIVGGGILVGALLLRRKKQSYGRRTSR